jgi:hypothetical protein
MGRHITLQEASDCQLAYNYLRQTCYILLSNSRHNQICYYSLVWGIPHFNRLVGNTVGGRFMMSISVGCYGGFIAVRTCMNCEELAAIYIATFHMCSSDIAHDY